jgi:hypothetical protein
MSIVSGAVQCWSTGQHLVNVSVGRVGKATAAAALGRLPAAPARIEALLKIILRVDIARLANVIETGPLGRRLVLGATVSRTRPGAATTALVLDEKRHSSE